MNTDDVCRQLATACDLWGRGLSVIPVEPRAKRPAVAWQEYQSRRATAEEIDRWFGTGASRNIGIVTGAVSGIVVVDVDSGEAAAWADAHLPATPMRVRTAHGEHRYYRHPGGTVRNRARLRTGVQTIALDVRGDGGYVVGPGSTHESGNVYERVGEWPPIEQLPVFECRWLSDDQAQQPAPAPVPGECIPAGARNSTLASIAGRMRRAGCDTETIAAALRDVNARRCAPALDDNEVETIAESVARYEPGGDDREERIRQETERERARREARRRLDAEDRGPVTPPDSLTLRDWLAEPDPLVRWRITGWQSADSRVILAAQFKAGKTTARDNLVRSLVDGDAWLGTAAVTPITGTVAVLDTEMSRPQMKRWLRDQRIVHDDRVLIVPLRGRCATLDLLDAPTRTRWADWLRARHVTYLILDSLRPVLDALGLDESHDCGRFLVPLDTLLAEAGITECLVVHHMGHLAERSRGDSRLRDWPDAEWRLVRQDDEPASARYISAYGRDVDVPESQLTYSRATRHLTIAGGTRRDAKAREALPAICGVVVEKGPLSGRRIKEELAESEFKRDRIDEALHYGVRVGTLAVTPGSHGAILYRVSECPRLSADCPPDSASECPAAYIEPDTRTLTGDAEGQDLIRTLDAPAEGIPTNISGQGVPDKTAGPHPEEGDDADFHA